MFGLMLGLVAVPALGEVGRLNDVTADPERLYLVAATVFFPPILAGILLSAVIAAVMSTADSQLLLASAMATDDLPLIRRYAYAKRYVFVLGAFARVWMGRFLLVVVGIVAAVLSIFNPDFGTQSGLLRLGRNGRCPSAPLSCWHSIGAASTSGERWRQ